MFQKQEAADVKTLFLAISWSYFSCNGKNRITSFVSSVGE